MIETMILFIHLIALKLSGLRLLLVFEFTFLKNLWGASFKIRQSVLLAKV